jgi:hypothetical protein
MGRNNLVNCCFKIDEALPNVPLNPICVPCEPQTFKTFVKNGLLFFRNSLNDFFRIKFVVYKKTVSVIKNLELPLFDVSV